MISHPKSIRGLSDVFASYDGFIFDLWGVLHDGTRPFSGAIPALQALKKAKKKIWLLSNAPRRTHAVAEFLAHMCITPDLYDGIMTSGEAVWQALQDELLEKWGRRCFHIGRDYDTTVYEGLDIRIVDDFRQADFVLNSGGSGSAEGVEMLRPLLQNCVIAGLPMICANPDKVVHVGDQLVFCSGTFADMYARMEGEVIYFGKPYRGVYKRCLEEMESRRVLAVGDSMLTDIAGATGAGLDCALVTSGIHREELHGREDLGDFLSEYHYRPTFVMREFGW